jgi:hypothetical protein
VKWKPLGKVANETKGLKESDASHPDNLNNGEELHL